MEVLCGGRIVPSESHVGSALKLLEQSIKLSVSESFDCDNLAFPITPSVLNIVTSVTISLDW